MTSPRSSSDGRAPRDVFETILEWAVIPTFDLVLSYGDQGVIVVRRKMAPYRNLWALPGLRMIKSESIDETLSRIAESELGLRIDPGRREFLGQYVGKFRTERNRQDLSTGYHIPVDASQPIVVNSERFSRVDVVRAIPTPIGAMYRYYLERFYTGCASSSSSGTPRACS